MNRKMNLKKERKKIDQLDLLLLKTMAQRIKIAATIQAEKRKLGLPQTDQKREQEILTKIRRLAKQQKIDPKLASSIIKKIIAEGKRSHKLKNPNH
ncbi:chorismate mutase [Candidatus Woesearchaeota archaeon]|nr:chorismate mutase [Candidatus Woesearchaeota archaeon]